MPYLCTVFFMVLDLRLRKIEVVVMTALSVFIQQPESEDFFSEK